MSPFPGIRPASPLVAIGLLVFATANALSAGAPMSASQLALYQGADRETILIQGAKKEGQVVFYNSHTWFKAVAQEFEKKYPFIKVAEWRAEGADVMKRAIEESQAGRFLADVVESTAGNIGGIYAAGLLQEHRSPELRFFDDDVTKKGKSGVYYWADRETYISLGFNTNHIPAAEAPKRLNDLLDPKWKGKMSLAGGATAARWVGAVIDMAGREFIEKLSVQDVNVHNLSGAALANLVVTGEVPMSPTIFDSNIFVAKRKGAAVEWRPLDPVVANVGYSGILAKAPHPHAALLFIDYLHSKEGQQFIVKGGLSSPRDDVESLVNQKFKKIYFEAKYSLDEYEKKLSEWEGLIQKLLIRRR
jgi:iron(III) transport system substrate-binding protein